jgi:FkbM family methyltransferase
MIDFAARVKQGFAKAGIGLTSISNTLPYRRQRFLRDLGVSVVLDVGANIGQYASELRKHGYEGRLVSFEPLGAPFKNLSKFAAKYQNHNCLQVALGDADEKAQINVSENIVSSSLLTVSHECVTACDASRRVGTETIQVRRLDTVRDEVVKPSDRVHLKIDTQGTEREVLLGGAKTLEQVASIELELSLAPLYDNQPLFTEMCEFLELRAFRCVWIERGFTNEHTGHTLQVDGFFVRLDAPNGSGG